jgi:hypothetical protein
MTPDSEILIETTRIGNTLEVRAISGEDGLEVSFQAPASAIEADIHRLARAKLSFVRNKLAEEQDEGEAGPDRRGGIIA